MSEVLFGQSYYLRFDAKLWAAMQPYPPLGTLYAAAALRARGHEVAVFDAMLASSEAEWADALDTASPRYAVIYEDNFNYLSKMCLLRMRQAAFAMLAAARERGCTVVVCGSDATDHAGRYLAAGADYVLAGEGESTLCELMDWLTGRPDTPLESIQGVIYRRPSDGRVHRTGARPVMRELDALPEPARDLIDMGRYREIWLRRHGYFSTNAVTTRGCPYHCNWCAKPIWGQRYNVRSPERVAAELRRLKGTYSADHVWFADDIMGLKPGWLRRFADEVAARDARLPFKCLSRADLLLRDGDIEALRRAGCEVVWIGAESGSQRVLDAMEKGIRVEQIREAATRLKAAGVRVGFFLQFGYPGEGREDIALTFQLVRDCRPDDIGVSVSYPLPGTKFYERIEAQLGEKRNWTDSEDLAMLYRGPFSTAFYRKLHTILHREFRLRRGWDEWASWARRPWRERRPPLRQAAKLVWYATTLPFERWRLERLARQPHEGLGPLPAVLQPDEAATPSPQADEVTDRTSQAGSRQKQRTTETRRAWRRPGEPCDAPIHGEPGQSPP